VEPISRRRVLTVIGGLTGAAALAACSQDEEPSLADTPSTTYHWGDDDPEDSATSSSTSSESPSSGGGLTTVSLDAPDELRNRWAAYAAMWTAASISGEGTSSDDTGPRAEGGDWIYEMETGQWAYLIRFTDGRALLAGQGNPDIRRGAKEEKAAREELVAGGPSWWKTFATVVPEFNSVGFVLGWDGKKWQRAAAAGGRGFAGLTFYIATPERLREQLATWGSGGTEGYSASAGQAADRVMKAGPKVTVAQLKALGPGMKSARLPDAVAVAKAFEGKGKH